MTRSLAFLVVAVLLCIILSSQTADGLQCKGERLHNGTFFFNASYEVKKDIRDCETQWLIDEKLVGLSEADGYTEVSLPVVMATANTAILQTCPEKLQCLLVCPSGNIMKKMQCLCDTTPPTTLPEGFEFLDDRQPRTTVGFPNGRIGVWIGSAFVVFMIVTVTIVLCRKKQRSGSAAGSTGSAEVVPFNAEDV